MNGTDRRQYRAETPDPGPPSATPPNPLPGGPIPVPTPGPDLPPVPVPPVPNPQTRAPRAAALAVFALVASLATGAAARTKDGTSGGIVINPTREECARGWTEGATKLNRQQFGEYCATLRNSGPIFANPTIDQCRQGWSQKLRWSREEFQKLCTGLRKSK